MKKKLYRIKKAIILFMNVRKDDLLGIGSEIVVLYYKLLLATIYKNGGRSRLSIKIKMIDRYNQRLEQLDTIIDKYIEYFEEFDIPYEKPEKREVVEVD